MPNLEEESIPPCKICGKIWKRKEYKKWFCYKDVIFCFSHHGIKEYAEEKYNKMNELLELIQKDISKDDFNTLMKE